MNKVDALKHFEENYVVPVSQETLIKLDEYYNKNIDNLVHMFMESFRQICLKIVEMQTRGFKWEIGHIVYSMLRTNILEENYKYLIYAYEPHWTYDKGECWSEYDVSWAFRFLGEYMRQLEEKRRLYLNRIIPSDLDKIRLKELYKYNARIVKLARCAMPKAVEINEYGQFRRSKVFKVRVGEYRETGDVVYVEDKRIKDSNEIKGWLREKFEGEYKYAVINNLDLSAGDYSEIDLRYADLGGSNLSNCNMKKCILTGANLNEADLSFCDMRGAQLDGAHFYGAILNKTIFSKESMDVLRLEEEQRSTAIFK